MRGRAIQVISGGEEVVFYEEATRKILLNADVKDLPVAVVSVAGALRRGKSFFLSFCLRYLRRQSDQADWLAIEGEDLTGFEWKAGSTSVTKGISFWSEVFTVTTSEGKKVALLLVDTEGVFNVGSTMTENVNIFTLSTLISSVQIYNIMQMIRQDDLQHLEMFSNYSEQVWEETQSGTPFQKLVFLVRDWTSPQDHKYGYIGGKEHLDRCFGRQKRGTGENIKSSFSSIECFLMSHPGKSVAVGNGFEGNLKDIDVDFLENIRDIMPWLLHPDKLVVKSLGNQPFTCQMLFSHIKMIVKGLASNNFPEPADMLQTAAEVGWLGAEKDALASYAGAMDAMTEDSGFLPQRALQNKHEELKKVILRATEEKPLLNKTKFLEPFLAKISEAIDKEFEGRKRMNQLCADAYCKNEEEDAEKLYRKKISEVYEYGMKFTAVLKIERKHYLTKDEILENVRDKKPVIQGSDFLEELLVKIGQKLNAMLPDVLMKNKNEAEHFCHEATEKALDLYRNGMLECKRIILDPEKLELYNKISKEKAVTEVVKIRDLPTPEFHKQLLQKVVKEIDSMYMERTVRNEKEREEEYQRTVNNKFADYKTSIDNVIGDMPFISSVKLEGKHQDFMNRIYCEISDTPQLQTAGLVKNILTELNKKLSDEFKYTLTSNRRNAEAYMSRHAPEYVKEYVAEMKQFLPDQGTSDAEIERKHEEIVWKIKRKLENRLELANTEYLKQIEDYIEEDIRSRYEEFVQANKSRDSPCCFIS